MIHVVNKRLHKRTPNDCPVHRGASPLGNPYDWRGSPLALFGCGSRAEAISKYQTWFDAQIAAGNEEVLDELRKIYRMAKAGDVNLVCYCAPDFACHASIIKDFINKQLNNGPTN